MKKEALIGFPYPTLTVIGLLIFFTFFLVMIFWLFHKSQKDKLEYSSRIPLADNNEQSYSGGSYESK